MLSTDDSKRISLTCSLNVMFTNTYGLNFIVEIYSRCIIRRKENMASVKGH
jgi:hypothetical protein